MAVEDDDYELIPKHELDSLKREVEKLKKNPLGDLPAGETLIDSVNSLNNNIKKLIELFATTESELAKEYSDHNPVQEIRAIREQNEQIAQGLLTVADLVKDVKEQVEARKDQPVSNNPGGGGMQVDQFGLPMSPSDDFSLPDLNAPFGLPPQQQGPTAMPAPEKKKGLWGR